MPHAPRPIARVTVEPPLPNPNPSPKCAASLLHPSLPPPRPASFPPSQAGLVDTSFIDRHIDTLLPPASSTDVVDSQLLALGPTPNLNRPSSLVLIKNLNFSTPNRGGLHLLALGQARPWGTSL